MKKKQKKVKKKKKKKKINKKKKKKDKSHLFYLIKRIINYRFIPILLENIFIILY